MRSLLHKLLLFVPVSARCSDKGQEHVFFSIPGNEMGEIQDGLKKDWGGERQGVLPSSVAERPSDYRKWSFAEGINTASVFLSKPAEVIIRKIERRLVEGWGAGTQGSSVGPGSLQPCLLLLPHLSLASPLPQQSPLTGLSAPSFEASSRMPLGLWHIMPCLPELHLMNCVKIAL